LGMCDCVARLLRINVIEQPEVGYICLLSWSPPAG